MSAESNAGHHHGPDKDRWRRARREQQRDQQRQTIPGQRFFGWYFEDQQQTKTGGNDGPH